MKDSIVVDMKYAGYDMIDGTPKVHRHHIFEGTANRRLSDEDSDLMYCTTRNMRRYQRAKTQ